MIQNVAKVWFPRVQKLISGCGTNKMLFYYSLKFFFSILSFFSDTVSLDRAIIAFYVAPTVDQW